MDKLNREETNHLDLFSNQISSKTTESGSKSFLTRSKC